MSILVPTKAQLAKLMPSVIANLAKKLKADDGAKLAPGKYRVQATATVEVDAYLTKSADGEYTPTDMPLKALEGKSWPSESCSTKSIYRCTFHQHFIRPNAVLSESFLAASGFGPPYGGRFKKQFVASLL